MPLATNPGTAKALKDLIRPIVPSAILRARAEREFFSEKSWYAKHLGKFDSFAEANRYIQQKNIDARGYVLDHEAWLAERTKLSTHDYPPLFWIGKLIFQNNLRTVADFGGSAGVSYYAFKNYLAFPQDLAWTVCELPEAVAAGTRITKERQEHRLTFVEDARQIASSQVFYAAGVLHYLEQTPAQLLESIGAKPEYLVLNKLPLSQKESFVTIESGGNGYYPCRIQAAPSFISELRASGYEVVDRWRCLEHRMDVGLHPELSFPHYQGFVFTRSRA
ncbi:hypothetical protein GALL_259670 [mine drainage metagenome]|uniref:Methyltransferase, TIGR04325 family n=1 Tax=mine drainage metagenome TaxID=410659 RepID=A0A1J5R9V9_9ZZZZ